MASGGSFKSRGKVQQNCDSCKQDGKQKDADYYCKECQEYLCNDCKDAHNRVSMTRGHEVTNINMVSDVPAESLRSMSVTSPESPTTNKTTSPETKTMRKTSAQELTISDEMHYCDPCKTDGKNIEAIYNCDICKEYMCGGCGDGHRKYKFSKDHELTNLHGSTHTSKNVSLRNNNDVILNLSPQSISKVNVKVANDKEVPRITACRVLSTGELFMCDHMNCNIKLLNKSLKVSDSITLGCSRPWDIAVVNDKTAIVTLPNDKQLQYVDLVPKLSLGSRMSTKQKCYGIVVVNELIYITCHGERDNPGGDIRVLDLRGNELKIIGVNRDGSQFLRYPYYIAANREGSKLYVTSFGTYKVICMSPSGDIVYKLHENDADIVSPHGVYVDSQDNLLVCSTHTGTIQVITANGTKHKTLLTSYDDVRKPMGITFCAADSTLIVGLFERDEIVVVKLA